MQVEEEINRGGTLVFINNRVYGGGISYYFIGTYEEVGQKVSITVNAIKYNDIVAGLFGSVDEARLVFNGLIDGPSIVLHGHVEDKPDKKLVIHAEKRSDIG